MSWCLMSSDVAWHIRDKLWPMPIEARFSNSSRPRKPEGSLGRTAQDVRLDSHTAPELWNRAYTGYYIIYVPLGVWPNTGTFLHGVTCTTVGNTLSLSVLPSVDLHRHSSTFVFNYLLFIYYSFMRLEKKSNVTGLTFFKHLFIDFFLKGVGGGREGEIT